jgi:cytochrome c oxidase assembly protein subunit 15
MTGLPHAVSYADVSSSRSRRDWPQRSRLTAVWLFAVAAIVGGMVVLGGATRLTGSGLSITDWKPVSGALPPMSGAEWADLFRRYRAIPQYRVVNPDMTLAGFKAIFWWEWSHRLLGRLLGVTFALPLVGLLFTRRLPRRLAWPCVGLFVLGGLQGLVGWWMVSSGLETRIWVAPERLAAHLGLALILLSALIWTGLEAGWGGADRTQVAARARAPRGWLTASIVFAGGVYLQCLMGALVAGNHAGLANADWPLMSGRLFPSDYWQAGGLWTTIAHGLAAVQFDHRMLAYGLAIFAVVLAVRASRSPGALIPVKRLTLLALAIVALQIMLGVSLLLGGVPTGMALAHQLTACSLLVTTVALVWVAMGRYHNTST